MSSIQELVAARVAELQGDWRGAMFIKLRDIVAAAHPDLQEAWKWDTLVWECSGQVVALGVFKNHLRLNFFSGAALADSRGLFNAGLEAKKSRGIDFHEGSTPDQAGIQDLVVQAVERNRT